MMLSFLFMMFALIIGILRLMSTNLFYTPILANFYPLHSFVMVFGFLAAVIMTERVAGVASIPAALHVRSPRVMVPLTIGGVIVGVTGYLMGLAVLRYLGGLLLVSGSVAFLLTLRILGRSSGSRLPFDFMMLSVVSLIAAAALSAVRLAVGNLGLVMLLVGFPILFILGERVELTRFTSKVGHTARFRAAFLMAAGCVTLYVIANFPSPPWVVRVTFLSGSILLLMVFIVLANAESEMIGQLLGAGRPLQKYVATHVRLAYVWGIVGMALAVTFALSAFALNLYDAFIHALTIGFVGTMILGHGPVIFPGFMRKKLAEDRLSRLPLVVLSTAVVLRVGSEILLLVLSWQVLNLIIAISGWLVLVTVLLFIGMTRRAISASAIGRKDPERPRE